MTWRARFEDIITELEAHSEIEVLQAELGKPATAKDLEAAAAQVPYQLPESITAFYREMNGASIQWRHRDPNWAKFGVQGTIKLFDVGTVFREAWAEDNYGNKSWLPFDWPADEYYAGFDRANPDVVWWVFDTADEGRPLEASFETYLEALLETRGYNFWQEMFSYDAERAARLGATVEQAEGRMQAVLPLLFDSFDVNKVGQAAALDPADISALTHAQAIVVYQLEDLPAELTAHIPDDAALWNCLFWIARPSTYMDPLFNDIPEPHIDLIYEGLDLGKSVALSATQTRKLAEILRPDAIPVGGSVTGGAIDGGYHTGDADAVKAWMQDQGLRLVPLSAVWQHLSILEVRDADDRLVEDVEFSSFGVNVGLTYYLDGMCAPGRYAIDRLDSKFDHFELLRGEARAEVRMEELPAGTVTAIQLK